MKMYQVFWQPPKRLRAHIPPVFCLPYWIEEKEQAEEISITLNDKTKTGTYEIVEYETGMRGDTADPLPTNPSEMDFTG